jgi:colanic acid/amylovoran biosynthesis protein
VLKYIWRKLGLRKVILERRLSNSVGQWRSLRDEILPGVPDDAIMIIPPDPYLIVSSIGDTAMLDPLISHVRIEFPEHKIYIVTASDAADEAVRTLGLEPLQIARTDLRLADVFAIVEKRRFRAAYLMGADGLDGSYDPYFSGMQIIMLDAAARTGARATITGFSVSQMFHPMVQQVFREIALPIRINLRDPLSYQRFVDQTGVGAHKVADIAFLLDDGQTGRMAPIIQWIGRRRDQNHKIVGINFHPLLLELSERDKFPSLVDAFIQSLRQLASRHPVSFLMISHDTRGSSSDIHGLKPIEEALRAEFGERILYPEIQLGAAEIKGLVKHVDMVVSGRMHLMIAALGAGTPVFGIEYKGKMKGLLQYFGLDTAHLTSADEILHSPGPVSDKIERFLEISPRQRTQIASQVPAIRQLAEANFALN